MDEHTRVLRRLVSEMYGGLGQEVRAIRDELHATKQEQAQQATKYEALEQELQTTKQDHARKHETMKRKLDATKQELDETKQELDVMKQELRGELAEVKEDLEEQIDDIMNQTCQQLDFDVDEQLTSAKSDLLDFVRDEMENASAGVIRHLRDTAFYLDVESP